MVSKLEEVIRKQQKHRKLVASVSLHISAYSSFFFGVGLFQIANEVPVRIFVPSAVMYSNMEMVRGQKSQATEHE